MKSCLNCKFCVVGYEHSKVCDVKAILIQDSGMAEECDDYIEYNRWEEAEQI